MSGITTRQLFFYEAPEDGGGDPDAEPDVEPVVDPGPDPDGAAEAAAWALSQDDWNATVNYLQQTAPVIQQVAQLLQAGALQPQQQQYAQPQPDPIPEMDPFDPDSVTAYINASIQRGIAEGMQPFQPVLNSLAETEGQRLAREQMDRLDNSIGSFDHDAAYMIAAGALGDQNLDPNVVLEGAARYMNEFEKRIREDERNRYKQELQGLRDNPSDTPVGSAAAQETETVPTGPRRYHEAVERVLARRNPTLPVG